VAKSTATRDLTDIVKKSVLKTTGEGKRALKYIRLVQKSQKRAKK
jgi:predicted HTH transcriptional regulator